MENETNAPSPKSDRSLDLFFGADKPPLNEFHVSDVEIVDLKENNIDDNEEEISDVNDIIGKEIIVDSQIAESEIVDTFDSKVVGDEDYSLQEEKEEKEEWNDSEALLEDDGEVTVEEDILRIMSSIYNRIPMSFTIQSDIEEVDEQEEKSGTPVSQFSQQPERSKTILASATAMLSTDDLLLQAKNKMISRAASILEQRLKTIAALKELFKERKKLTLKNRFLNDKCCEYLKKMTTVNLFENTDGALPIYGNQAYYNVLEEFMDTKVHYDKKKTALEMETQNLTDSYYICRTRFENIFGEFMSRELEVGSASIDAKTGRGMSEHKVRSLVNKQQRKFDQLAEVRVYYLKLHNLLVRIQNSLRALNLMGEGHTLMEYEQLVIVNNTSMDKLDEREDELLKLKDACNRNITILNCMKQSSEAYTHDIMDMAKILKKVTDMKNEARSTLAFQRLKRDAVRKNTLKIHSATGILNSPRLLRKMEVDSHTLAVLKHNMHRDEKQGP